MSLKEEFARTAENVKIVSIPGRGSVYVCPYPPSHFGYLVAEKKRVESPQKPTGQLKYWKK